MSDPTKHELLFGRIALHNKLITDDQYKTALALRKRRTDDSQDLGRILRAKGYLDDKQYRSVRKAQEKHLTGKGMSKEEAQRAARGRMSGGRGKRNHGGWALPGANRQRCTVTSANAIALQQHQK